MDCCICLSDSVVEPVVTRCGHVFCWACIYRWAWDPVDEHKRCSCPICKAWLPNPSTHVTPIYGRSSDPNCCVDSTISTDATNISIPPRPLPQLETRPADSTMAAPPNTSTAMSSLRVLLSASSSRPMNGQSLQMRSRGAMPGLPRAVRV